MIRAELPAVKKEDVAGAPTDPQIARAAVEALKMDLPLTWERIQPTVKEAVDESRATAGRRRRPLFDGRGEMRSGRGRMNRSTSK